MGQIITCDVHFMIQAPNLACTSIVACLKKKRDPPKKIQNGRQKSKMASTKLGQVTLSSKLLTFFNNPKNKSCSPGQNTYT